VKLLNFENLWDDFIEEKTKLEQVLTSYKDEDDRPDLALIGKVRRGRRKGGLERG
jgi:hypothetical protein